MTVSIHFSFETNYLQDYNILSNVFSSDNKHLYDYKSESIKRIEIYIEILKIEVTENIKHIFLSAVQK